MNLKNALRPLGVIGAAFLLQGCLAAAIPVVAGGMLATKDVVDESRERGSPGTAPAMAPSVEVNEQLRTATVGKSSDWKATDLSQLPAPDPGQPASADSLTLLTQYATTQLNAPDKEVMSASLANPGALDGARIACSDRPRAVLFDLDPDGALLPIDTPMQSDPRSGILLDNLRRNDVTIGWISGRNAMDAGRLRNVLKESGLDSLGQDTLLLMRYADDRKQTRRAEFAREYCLLAIAGDTRADFDELFNYLKDPAAAAPLDALLGNGWFLTPSILMKEQDPTNGG